MKNNIENELDGLTNDQQKVWKKLSEIIQPYEGLRIDASGNIGIGTSAPQGKFHVVGKQ